MDTNHETAQEKRISVLESNVTHIDDSIKAFSATINDNFKDLRDAVTSGITEVHRRVDKVEQHSQISWPLVVSIIVLITILCGGLVSFVSMTVTPVKENAEATSDHFMTHMEKMPDVYEKMGRRAKAIEVNEKLIADLKTRTHVMEQEISGLKADNRAQQRQLDAVDHGGSRKWIGASKAN